VNWVVVIVRQIWRVFLNHSVYCNTDKTVAMVISSEES